jgi:prephenate dehydratase
MTGRIAFQGEPGAYMHQACRQSRPAMEALPCASFEDVIETVRQGGADLGMLAVENSTYGRIADVHTLLPQSGLFIVDESFVRVHVNLLAVKGAQIGDVKRVRAWPSARLYQRAWSGHAELARQRRRSARSGRLGR